MPPDFISNLYVFELLKLGCADDGRRHSRLSRHPVQPDLGRRAAHLLGNLLQGIQHLPVPLGKFVEDGIIGALQHIQPAALAAGSAFAGVLAGEEPAGQRTPGTDAQSQARAPREHVRARYCAPPASTPVAGQSAAPGPAPRPGWQRAPHTTRARRKIRNSEFFLERTKVVSVSTTSSTGVIMSQTCIQ